MKNTLCSLKNWLNLSNHSKAYEKSLIGHVGDSTPARRLTSAILKGINEGQTAADVIQAETSDEAKAIAGKFRQWWLFRI